MQPQLFIGKRNLIGTPAANTAGVWRLYNINQMRHYNFIYGSDLKDEYFPYTTLLIKSTATNGGQNNSFLDGSDNNRSITRNGDASQGAFTPYEPFWSVYFDGTGDYLTIPDNGVLDMDNLNFTIEGWYYPIATPSSSTAIFAKRADGTEINGVLLYFPSASLTPEFLVDIGGSWAVVISSSISFNLGKWNHFAAVRNGNTFTLYINGVSAGTATNSGVVRDNTRSFVIGAMGSNGAGAVSACHISNFRVVKGTAIYTANFTPPTQPLTSITNTSLLTCATNRFNDISSIGHTITINGEAAVLPFSPFTTPANPYTVDSNGGGLFFDGAGDYLESSTGFGSSSFSNDFTIEGWLYRKGTATDKMIVGNGVGDSDYISDSAAYISAVTFTNANFPVSIRNAWTHFAWVRVGSAITLYRNGKSIYTGSSSSNQWNFSQIGVWQGSFTSSWDGYISDLRFVNGTALYTADFTPPTAPLTKVTNTSLLLSGTNYNIFDATQNHHIGTSGNAQVSTSVKKDELSSISFDGSGDTLFIPDSVLLRPEGVDFTLEFSVYFNNITGYQTIINKGYIGAGAYTVQTGNGNGRLVFSIAGTAIMTETGTGSAGVWIHYAIVRSGNNYTIYRNGTSSATGTSSTNLNNTSTLVIGDRGVGTENGTPAYPLNGYIENLRFTKGIARYTANFTPTYNYYTR